ncbi:MAG: glycosyltransferase [Candidatus Aenigmarchaeota archaeon]|nr:glycosyltransferase [Candidatus Aenigmarchaeota archaeon]
MKMAFFTDTYKPQINGVVRSIDLFAKELRKRHSVYILSPSKTGDKFSYGFSSIEFKNYPGYRIALPHSMIYDNLFSKVRFDIVHVHSPFTTGLAGLMFARKRKIPVVGTFHTLFPEYLHYLVTNKRLMQVKWIKSYLKNMSWSYLRSFYNKCDAVIAPTEGIRGVLKKNGIKNVHVLPTGIDAHTKSYDKGVKKKFGLAKKIILHVGRITEEKKIGQIMTMLRPVLAKGDAALVVTSDGPYRKRLEEKSRELGIEDNVIFTGYLREQELQGFYHAADVFVMASETETQGLVLLEAAFAGLPCVVMEAPVVGDFVRENKIGHVATAKTFASAVRKYLTTRTRLQTTAIRKKYDIKFCAQKLESLYNEVLKG